MSSFPSSNNCGDAQALRTGVGEIDFLRDTQLKQGEMFGPADTRNDQMQIVNLFRIDLYQGTRKEISLFLVIAFEHDRVAADDESFQSLDDFFSWRGSAPSSRAAPVACAAVSHRAASSRNARPALKFAVPLNYSLVS